MISKYLWKVITIAFPAWLFLTGSLFAHDPVFSPGPHVLFKDGVEIHAGASRDKQDNATEDEQSLAFKYGLTGDWVAGVEIPYERSKDELATQKGVGDITLSTKYRFWRKDTMGAQESAAVLLKLKPDSSGAEVSTDTTDLMLGFTYGYESLKWYRWASMRYRFNQDRGDLQRGDRLFVDMAIGYRPQVHDYRAADTVLILELNGEIRERNALNGVDINASGGNQWFVSPGVLWTLRNFAVKAGVQIPIYSNLNGNQPRSDYRASLELEWHL